MDHKLFKKVALEIFNKKEDFVCVALKKEFIKNKKEVKFFSELFDPNSLFLNKGVFTEGPWFGDFRDVDARNSRVLACLFAYEMAKEKRK